VKREKINVDVLCVGGGIASLSTVLQLLNQIEKSGLSDSQNKKSPSIMIIEKGRKIGSHALSGAVVDSESLSTLLGDCNQQKHLPKSHSRWNNRDVPLKGGLFSYVSEEKVCFLTEKHSFRLPFLPPLLKSKGFPIVSLSKLTKLLGKICEEKGAEIFSGFAAVDLIEKNNKIVGVKLGDKGLDKFGNKKNSFMPGAEIFAKVVLLGEGASGILTNKLINKKRLAENANEQLYALGIKELIEIPASPETVGNIIHTFSYPLDYNTYGGGFLYRLNETTTAVGLVTGLDYKNAELNAHELFREYKKHPLIKKYLKGGKVIEYGAKVIPEGGYFSVPKLVADGAIIVGDGAGLVDSVRMKGIHLSVQSGIAAGDALFDCWRENNWSKKVLENYPKQFYKMSGWKQLTQIRNSRASFQYGLLAGIFVTGLSVLTNGLLPFGRLKPEADYSRIKPHKEHKST